ncbi:MAG: hypothetical protein ACPGSD_17430 [Flavobacteriales bacterium]
MSKYFITKDDSFQKELKKELIDIDKKVNSKTTSMSAMDGTKFEQVVLFILGLFQTLISNLALHIQFDNQLKEFIQLKRESKQKTQALNQELQILIEKQRKHILSGKEKDLSFLKHVFTRWRLMMMVIGFLTLGELIFNYRSFQVISPNVALAMVLAFTIGLSLVIIAHFIAIRIRDLKHVWKQIVYGTISLIFISTIFFYIAELRLSYLSKVGFQSSEISHLSFTILNLLFFSTALLISYKYNPTNQQKVDFHRHRKGEAESIKQKEKINIIHKELKEIPLIISEKEQLIGRLLVFLKDQEMHIQNLYELKVQDAILNYTLQKGENIKAPPTPKLSLQYQSLNLEDYV